MRRARPEELNEDAKPIARIRLSKDRFEELFPVEMSDARFHWPRERSSGHPTRSNRVTLPDLRPEDPKTNSRLPRSSDRSHRRLDALARTIHEDRRKRHALSFRTGGTAGAAKAVGAVKHGEESPDDRDVLASVAGDFSSRYTAHTHPATPAVPPIRNDSRAPHGESVARKGPASKQPRRQVRHHRLNAQDPLPDRHRSTSGRLQ